MSELNELNGFGLILIHQERAKQLKRFSDDHDDEHKFGELRVAAIAYLLSPDIGGEGPIDHWPFERESFKPGVGIEPLVKAGAMIAAEIDRLLRAQAAQQEMTADREPFSMQSPPANPDATFRQHSPPDVSAQQLARLKAFEDVAEALWPFVRSFGLCGAHPTAIAAVVALGKLLGHTDASKSTIMEIGDKVRAEMIEELAGKLTELLRGRVLSRDIPGIVDKIREM